MALGKSSLRRAVDRHPVEADGEELGTRGASLWRLKDETLFRRGSQFTR